MKLKRITVLALTAVFTVVLFGCASGDRNEGITNAVSEPVNFERITISIQGTMAYSEEYEILKTEDGEVSLSYYEGPWLYDAGAERADCLAAQVTGDVELYKEINGFANSCGVFGWDGFSKSNPNVLDGESFSMEAVLVDGRTLYAHGTNSFPSGYGQFLAGLRDYLYGE